MMSETGNNDLTPPTPVVCFQSDNMHHSERTQRDSVEHFAKAYDFLLTSSGSRLSVWQRIKRRAVKFWLWVKNDPYHKLQRKPEAGWTEEDHALADFWRM